MVDGGLRHRFRGEGLAAELSRQRPAARSSTVYPSEGKSAIACPAGGYIWDRCAEAGVSYRSYGEFVDNGKKPGDPAVPRGQGAGRSLRSRSTTAWTSIIPT